MGGGGGGGGITIATSFVASPSIATLCENNPNLAFAPCSLYQIAWGGGNVSMPVAPWSLARVAGLDAQWKAAMQGFAAAAGGPEGITAPFPCVNLFWLLVPCLGCCMVAGLGAQHNRRRQERLDAALVAVNRAITVPGVMVSFVAKSPGAPREEGFVVEVLPFLDAAGQVRNPHYAGDAPVLLPDELRAEFLAGQRARGEAVDAAEFERCMGAAIATAELVQDVDLLTEQQGDGVSYVDGDGDTVAFELHGGRLHKLVNGNFRKVVTRLEYQQYDGDLRDQDRWGGQIPDVPTFLGGAGRDATARRIAALARAAGVVCYGFPPMAMAVPTAAPVAMVAPFAAPGSAPPPALEMSQAIVPSAAAALAVPAGHHHHVVVHDDGAGKAHAAAMTNGMPVAAAFAPPTAPHPDVATLQALLAAGVLSQAAFNSAMKNM